MRAFDQRRRLATLSGVSGHLVLDNVEVYAGRAKLRQLCFFKVFSYNLSWNISLLLTRSSAFAFISPLIISAKVFVETEANSKEKV